ncbi:MAG: hypothetical protein AAFY60_03575, partial [Myxococcota bacterium]
MRILFPAFPLDPTSADPDYEIECASAKAAGFTVGLLDLEALNAGNVSKAVRRVGADGAEPVLYRGWMLTHEAYVSLDNALRAKQLPPNLHFESPNPRCELEDSPFWVVSELTDWPAGATPRRAAVSS